MKKLIFNFFQIINFDVFSLIMFPDNRNKTVDKVVGELVYVSQVSKMCITSDKHFHPFFCSNEKNKDELVWWVLAHLSLSGKIFKLNYHFKEITSIWEKCGHACFNGFIIPSSSQFFFTVAYLTYIFFCGKKKERKKKKKKMIQLPPTSTCTIFFSCCVRELRKEKGGTVHTFFFFSLPTYHSRWISLKIANFMHFQVDGREQDLSIYILALFYFLFSSYIFFFLLCSIIPHTHLHTSLVCTHPQRTHVSSRLY